MDIQEQVDKLSSSAESVSADAFRIRRLADAFEVTGNSSMAHTLRDTAKSLEIAAEVVRRTTGPIVTNYLNGVEHAANNTVRAALAGIELAHKEQNSE